MIYSFIYLNFKKGCGTLIFTFYFSYYYHKNICEKPMVDNHNRNGYLFIHWLSGTDSTPLLISEYLAS